MYHTFNACNPMLYPMNIQLEGLRIAVSFILLNTILDDLCSLREELKAHVYSTTQQRLVRGEESSNGGCISYLTRSIG